MKTTVRSYCIALAFWLTVFCWFRIAESAHVGGSAAHSVVDRSVTKDKAGRKDILVQG